MDNFGRSHPNYHYENLWELRELYEKSGLENPAVIVDANHNNSGKRYMEQIRICKDVMHSRALSKDIHGLVKGLMVESYLEDGCQKPGEGVYGQVHHRPVPGLGKDKGIDLQIGGKLKDGHLPAFFSPAVQACYTPLLEGSLPPP